MKKGAYTLLITPFKKDYSLDEDALRNLVRRQIDSDIDGIAPLGVTGENPLLSDAEVKKVLKIVVEEAKGKKLILPDICMMGLNESLDRARMYADMGADYVVSFTPYFILPSQKGLINYFEKLADTCPVPVVLHSSKNRTGVELTDESTALLAKHPNIAGTKDGNKLLDHLAKLIYLTRDDDFLVFTGKDTTAYPLVSFGGAGTFTVAGNVIPDVMGKMIHYALDGNHKEARRMHIDYYPVFEACRFDTNPMAAKKALELMGLIEGPLRPPLTSMEDAKSEQLKDILKQRNIL